MSRMIWIYSGERKLSLSLVYLIVKTERIKPQRQISIKFILEQLLMQFSQLIEHAVGLETREFKYK